MSCALEPAGAFGASPDGAGTAGASGALGAGAVCAGTLSMTLPPAFGRLVAKYDSARLVTKKTPARTAVVRDRKFAEPVAPNRLPEAPLPNAAP